MSAKLYEVITNQLDVRLEWLAHTLASSAPIVRTADHPMASALDAIRAELGDPTAHGVRPDLVTAVGVLDVRQLWQLLTWLIDYADVVGLELLDTLCDELRAAHRLSHPDSGAQLDAVALTTPGAWRAMVDSFTPRQRGKLWRVLSDSIALLSPEDRAERSQHPGVTAHPQPDGWIEFHWAGKKLAEVPAALLLDDDADLPEPILAREVPNDPGELLDSDD